jgi:hypothetical protein
MIEQQETEKGAEQFHDWLSHLSLSGKWSMQVKIYLGISYVCVLDAIVLAAFGFFSLIFRDELVCIVAFSFCVGSQ